LGKPQYVDIILLRQEAALAIVVRTGMQILGGRTTGSKVQNFRRPQYCLYQVIVWFLSPGMMRLGGSVPILYSVANDFWPCSD
jgi:hypothetical protein